MVKNFLFTTLLLAGMQPLFYIPGDSGSSVKFKIKNLGISVTGSFTGLKGKIQFDPGNPAACSFEATIDAESVNTGNDWRDGDLRKQSYFDVKEYPQIRFVSTKVENSNRRGSLFITGNLTIRDITREVSFSFTATPQNGGFLFNGEFKINRRDFNVGGSSFTLSDNLTLSLSVFAPRG